MKTMNTKDIIRQAKNKGLCQPWYNDFKKNHSLKHLCEKYFEGSDWAMEHDFPNLETLRKFKGQSDEYGIHTDFEGILAMSDKTYHTGLFGNSIADIECSGFSVSEMIIRHHSKAKISAEGNAFVMINILDSAEIEVEATENAEVKIYNYSHKAKVRFKGNVKVFHSNFEK